MCAVTAGTELPLPDRLRRELRSRKSCVRLRQHSQGIQNYAGLSTLTLSLCLQAAYWQDVAAVWVSCVERRGSTLQGNRDNIDSMAGGSQKILNQVLKLIDQHDLYGSVAYPKKHQQKDISDIYLLPFATRGIFTNVALQEPFGLTVIEVSIPWPPGMHSCQCLSLDILTESLTHRIPKALHSDGCLSALGTRQCPLLVEVHSEV